MTATMTGEEFLTRIVEAVAQAVGVEQARYIRTLTLTHMPAQGGTPGEWARAMGQAATELGDAEALEAMLRALRAMDRDEQR